MATWLGILWGNTHHHWGWFEGDRLLSQQRFMIADAPLLPRNIQIRLAAVGRGSLPTPSDQIQILGLADIPLRATYPTLGLDRALALVAAGSEVGYPVLVIDGGTALTLSAAIETEQGSAFFGGAIMPGLGLQADALAQGTAALPLVKLWDLSSLPDRWAIETEGAIQSGILYTALSGIRDFIQDWRRHFPEGRVVFTGGDGSLLWTMLQDLNPDPLMSWDPALVLKGIPLCGR